MNIRNGKLALLMCAVILLGAGCSVPQTVQKEKTSTITYLISKEDPTKYCNGAEMDSAGYRKTITIEVATITPKANMTETELVKNTIIAATTGMCQEVMKQSDFKVASGTIYIPPIEGWAGVSITMCSCKPQVEVNVLRLPGIKQVIWDYNQTPAAGGETSVNDGTWKNTPAEIKDLYTKNSITYFSIDILTPNPNFLPGENDFFINQSKKLREVRIDNDTKFYKCGPGPDNIDTTADVSSSINDLLTYIQQKITKKDRPVIYYFDITESVVKNIYEQCLP